MMSDIEQLEAIAKYLGLEVHGCIERLIVQPGEKDGGLVIGNIRGGSSMWNPKTDNGDAFLLALNLQISVWRDDDMLYVGRRKIQLEPGDDAAAIARREIVFLATEFGKAP